MLSSKKYSLVLSIVILILIAGSLSSCSVSNGTNAKENFFEPAKDFNKNANNLAPEEEDSIGLAVAYKILSTYPAVKSEALNSYVNAVGQVVAAASERAETFAGYKFLVIDSKEINALAAPGGYIFVSRGLIEAINDEDSLAAVLAHEVSHVVKKHGLSAIAPEHFADYVQVGSVLASAVDCSGISQQLLGAFSGAVEDVYNTLMSAGYSRDQEFEADKEALVILEKAGYQPESLRNVLLLISDNKTSGGWFSTHPSPTDRIHESQAFIKNITLAEAGYPQRKERFLISKSFLKQ